MAFRGLKLPQEKYPLLGSSHKKKGLQIYDPFI